MEIKIVIVFSVIATVVQISLAAELSKSCVLPTYIIGADLATIQYANDTAQHGHDRAVVIIFTEVRSTLARYARGIRTKNKDEDLRTAFALNDFINAIEAGIIPSLEAIRTIQPAIDIDAGRNRSYLLLERISKNIFEAVESTQCNDTSEILAKIKPLDDDTQTAASILITNLFAAIRNDPVRIPADADTTLDCIKELATEETQGAFRSIFNGIRLLVDDRCTGKKAGSRDCLSKIQAAQNKASDLFESQLTIRSSAVRNILIAQLIKRIGIVAALYAVQSAQAAASG